MSAVVAESPTWEVLAYEYWPSVYRYAYRLTGNQPDAEDLAQDTFLRAFAALEDKGPGSMEGWLRRICRNLYLDRVRHNACLRIDALGEAEERVEDFGSDTFRQFEFRNLDVDVHQALTGLPEEFRAPVVLCSIDGHSYEETAQILGVKLGTVRSRVHRAKGMLRQSLEQSRQCELAGV